MKNSSKDFKLNPKFITGLIEAEADGILPPLGVDKDKKGGKIQNKCKISIHNKNIG